MTKSKARQEITDYRDPHPKYVPVEVVAKDPDKDKKKKWLEGRWQHPSGFCTPYNPLVSQGHEGSKPVSLSGVPLKVCDSWQDCPCYCHYEMDMMYEMTGMEREPAEQSPEYTAMKAKEHLATQIMLDSLAVKTAILAPLSNVGDTIDRPGIEGPVDGTGDSATGTPAAATAPRFNPTPTGRRARGQLEYDVLAVCRQFVDGVFDWEYCTPKNVSEEIGKVHAIEPPSTGAINAVWDRWERLEFATQDKKPSRFVTFSVDRASIDTLEQIKRQTKREKKRGQAEQKRGVLRPKQR